MKRIVSLFLVLCFCFGLAACGKSAAPSSASPSADAAAPAAAPAAAADAPAAAPAAAPAEPAPAPTPAKLDLQAMVDDLNAEEVAQRTEDDPSVGVFEVGSGENTIIYKFAMEIFQYVIMMAQGGDTESMNAYNRLLDSLPGLENSLENALHESSPEVNVVVYLMTDEFSTDVTAVVDNGEIVYDLVNGVGTAPADVQPIMEMEDLPPEIQAQLDELQAATEAQG